MATTNEQESAQEPTRDSNVSIEPQEKNDDGYPEEKSSVTAKTTRGKRPREYSTGDRVTAMVTVGGWLKSKKFTVDTYRDNNGNWQYQLKDELTGALAENGKWFGEGDLSFA